MTWSVRFDRGVTLAFDAPAPTPEIAPAQWTPDGYLRVRAWVARAGDLLYSDGVRTWTETRPREVLEDAALSFTGVPVTDDHPRGADGRLRLVDADSWERTARGHGVGTPRIVEDGDSVYLEDDLLITSADLLDKIKAGVREVSIGFRVKHGPPASNGDRDQIKLVGNHYAIVPRGRAGREVRLRFDGADADADTAQEIVMDPKDKADAVGAAAEMVEIVQPDGTPTMVPTWLASEYERLKALEAEVMAATPAEPAAPAAPPAEPPAPAAEPPAEPPAPAAEPPAEEPEEPAGDSLAAKVEQTARDLIAAKAPHLAELAKTASGDSLRVLLDAANATPAGDAAPAPIVPPTPWAPKPDDVKPPIKYTEGVLAKFAHLA